MAKSGIKIMKDTVTPNLQRLARQYPAATQDALLEEGFAIMSESQKQVPVMTGRLRSTGSVNDDTRKNRPSVLLSYGTNYAISVHEDLDASHTVGNALYLRNPFLAAGKGYLQRMARRILRRVG